MRDIRLSRLTRLASQSPSTNQEVHFMKQIHRVKTKSYQQGFTIGELMISVAIVGIIGAVAVPAYTEYMLKGRRAEAKAMIFKIAQRFERCFTEHTTYVFSGSTASCPRPTNDLEIAADNPLYYTFSIAPTATTYTITATASATYGQDRDTNCQTFTLNQAGSKTSSPGNTCWTR